MNYYRRYIGDFQRDTGHLSLAEVGAYDRLLDHYYASEQPLPESIDVLCRICRALTPEERDAVASVAGQFFPIESDSNRHNKRADIEIGIAAPAIEKMRAAGRDGAAKRWGNDRVPHADPINPPNGVTHGVAIEPPTTNHQPPSSTHQPPLPITSQKVKNTTRAARLCEQVLPNEWGLWATENRPDLFPESVFEEFRDYWCAIPGAKGCKLDWFATWRNWCRRQWRTASGKKSLQERNDAAFDEFERRVLQQSEKDVTNDQ